MRSFDAAETAALATGDCIERKFLWIVAKNRSTGADEAAGIWNGAVPVTANMTNGFTGASVSRDFVGAGSLIDVGAVPLTTDITARRLIIRLSRINAAVEAIIRTYDARGAKIEYGRGIFNVLTNILVADIRPWFIGQIDKLDWPTGPVGGDGSLVITAMSRTRELTIVSHDVRSHESQLERSGGTDHFYKDTAVVGQWILPWGKHSAQVGSDPRSSDPSFTNQAFR